MKLTAQEFDQLKDDWYKKLAESGFEDIELKGSPNFKPDIQRKEEYYRIVTHKAFNPHTFFKNKTDRVILQMHSEGLTHIAIVNTLAGMGICKHRNTIRNIIWRYQWKWNLRTHPPKYLKPPTPQ